MTPLRFNPEEMCDLILIGISDATEPFFPPEVMTAIRGAKVFSGGRRHHELVAHLLPPDAQWIDITVPMEAVFERYDACPSGQPIVIFASGDPLFFGFAATAKRLRPHARLTVYPSFNSLQLLAHRMLLPYHDMRVVSLTGRPWKQFDEALMRGERLLGVLTDKVHTPTAIATRMRAYGYIHYRMTVGEQLGNPEHERLSTFSLKDSSVPEPLGGWRHPNCLMLELTELRPPLFGIPDSHFALLDGREKMITKMPIRLLTLQALDLPRRHVLWDIGFCTGSVSIEAQLRAPHLCIEAFEVRPECEALMETNSRRFGALGITSHIGDFLTLPLDELPRPDAVFIGGHGGRLKEMMERVVRMMTDDAVIVFNSVTSPKVPTDSRQLWDEACRELHLHQESPLRIQLNDYNPIEILKCSKYSSSK